jgi:hypothetical protein
MTLKTDPNFYDDEKKSFRAFSAGDDFYEALINAHQDLTDEQSLELNAKLVLILANHVGDLLVLREALDLSRKSVLEKS